MRPIVPRAALCLALGALALEPALAQEKPPVTFVEANRSYFARGRSGEPVRYVVIHTIEGSAGSGINTFRYGRRRVSAHYIVDFDGKITQMVRDADTAWHAGNSLYNRRSIGIEHAGWAGRNRWTMEQYRASARITRWACDTYGIPKDRRHIIAHREVPGATHGDPGRYFDWDLYIRLVRGEGSLGGASPGGSTPGGSTSGGTTTGGTTPGGSNPGGSPAPIVRPEVQALAPAAGEVVGNGHFAPGDPARGLTGLRLRWAAGGPRPQQGARVFVEEVGGALRWESAHLPGGATEHRAAVALAHGRTYRWAVRVWDGTAEATSAWATFRTDFTRGEVVQTWPRDDEEVTCTPALRWRYEDPDGPQEGYRVWIDDDEDHAQVLGDTKELNGATGAYFVRGQLQPGRTYWWRVMAHDGNSNVAVSAWRRFRTSPDYVHFGGEGVSVRPLSPLDGGSTLEERPALRWAYHSGEQREQREFRVQVARQGGAGLLVDEPWTSAATGYLLRPTPPGSYQWRVRVWDGEEEAWTPWQRFVVLPPTSGISGAIAR